MNAVRSRSHRFVRAFGWLMFAAGILSFVFLFLRHGGSTVPKVRWRSQWGQPRWSTFRDPAGQFLIDHLSNWDVSAPFERFTRRTIGELIAVETVAIRRGKPTGILVVIRYAAPRAMPAAEWLKRVRPGGSLGDIFGADIKSRQPSSLAGAAALKVVAEDGVKGQRYHFESWFVPDGSNAYRITVAAPKGEFAEVEPTLRRMVSSFRFSTEN